MKPLLIAAGIIALLTGTALTSAAQHGSTPPGALRSVSVRVLPIPGLKGREITVLQTSGGSTPTGTVTGTTTVTPGTPTPTPVPYPDAVTLLTNMSLTFGAIKYVHFLEATDATPSNGAGVHFNVKARGNASCSPNAYHVTVTAYAKVMGTKQKQSVKYQIIHIKKTYYLKGKQTKNKWSKAKAKMTYAFGIQPASNPLFCTSGSGSGSSSSNLKTNPPVDLGPATFKGTAVWHVQITGSESYNGKKIPVILDVLITQDHYLPVLEMVTIKDTVDKQLLKNKYVLSNFGKKVKIKAP